MRINVLMLVLFLTFSSQVWAGVVGISTGAKTGTYIKIAQDVQGVCRNMDINVLESSGSLDNLERIINDKNTQFAIIQYDTLLLKKPLNQKEIKKIKMVFPLYNEEIHLLVSSNSNINTLSDLNGKRVNVGVEKSGIWTTATVIKDATDINWNDYNFSPQEAIKKLVTGDLDAMFYVAGKPIPVLKDMDSDSGTLIKLISISHPALDQLYIKTEIPSKTYSWQNYNVSTYAVKSILATYDYVSAKRNNDISQLAACISDNLDSLQANGHTKWKEVDPREYKNVKWPIHTASKKIIDGRKSAKGKRTKLSEQLQNAL